MSQILTSRYPDSDLQIVVSSSRKTTTTKQFYETETPGMIGLETEQLRELQRKLMEKISTSPSFDARTQEKPAENGKTTNGQAFEEEFADGQSSAARQQQSQEGSTADRSAPSVQHKESSEEGFANGDGSQVVSKKMTRVVTTSQSSVTGADNGATAVGREHTAYGRNGSSGGD